jgi:uncharacterized membrane protein
MTIVAKYVLQGILAIIPLWITWLVVDLVFRQLLKIGSPIVASIRKWLSHASPDIADQVAWPSIDNTLAILLTISILFIVGWAVNNVLGRAIFGAIASVLDRIPLVKSVYGGVRRLIATLQAEPEGGKQQRVVLINFPSEEMKTVGLLTRTMKEAGTGRELAIVYVPTTPNPTSGYLEIVPMEQVVWTDWTLDEAMNFIITGGAVAPERSMPFGTTSSKNSACLLAEADASGKSGASGAPA